MKQTPKARRWIMDVLIQETIEGNELTMLGMYGNDIPEGRYRMTPATRRKPK